MFDEPTEEPAERPFDPVVRAREKSDEFRMHAELCAVFEAGHKFDAQIKSLDAEIARNAQKAIGLLEKKKSADSPILPPDCSAGAMALLSLCDAPDLSTNDYHIHRRPGEVMILRFLTAEQVDSFYERFQAHFDAALNAYKEDERSTHAWKQDEKMQAYLDSLDAIEMKMADRYLRPIIKAQSVFVLSTQTADEIDILHLADNIMRVEASSVVGNASAPPDEPTESDRAWFFKLFCLRGLLDGEERLCFFAYLQKTDDF